jgi:hypothetical protein
MNILHPPSLNGKVCEDPGEAGPYHPDPLPSATVGAGQVLQQDLPGELARSAYHTGPDGRVHMPDGWPEGDAL